MKKPLKIYIIWDSNYNHGLKYAKLAYSLLNRSVSNPVDFGAGIPVKFVTELNFSEIVTEFKIFEAVLCFFMIEDNFLSKSDTWNAYLKILENFSEDHLYSFPLAVDNISFEHIELFKGVNYIVLPKNNKLEYFLFTISYETNRILNHLKGSTKDIKVFLSHSKNTGDKKVKNLRNELMNNTKIKTFYDSMIFPTVNASTSLLKSLFQEVS